MAALSGWQKFFTKIFPKAWAESTEADSRRWMVRCRRCEFSQSVWDMGGIRWKAYGEPRWYLKCMKCGERSWHVVSKDRAA